MIVIVDHGTFLWVPASLVTVVECPAWVCTTFIQAEEIKVLLRLILRQVLDVMDCRGFKPPHPVRAVLAVVLRFGGMVGHHDAATTQRRKRSSSHVRRIFRGQCHSDRGCAEKFEEHVWSDRYLF